MDILNCHVLGSFVTQPWVSETLLFIDAQVALLHSGCCRKKGFLSKHIHCTVAESKKKSLIFALLSEVKLVCLCLLSCSVVSSSLQLHGLQPAKLLCPWNFAGKNMGVGCHFLLQGIFMTQGLNLCVQCLLRCRQILYPLSHWGSPVILTEKN